MALVLLSSRFERALFTDHLSFHAFVYHMRQVSVQTLVKFSVAAIVDTWNALYTTFLSVLKSLTKWILFPTIAYLALDCYLIYLFLLVGLNLCPVECFATFSDGTLCSFFQV